MKKALIVLLTVLIMAMSMSMAVTAAPSKHGTPTDETSKKSPKTGGYDELYALVGIALLTGVLVISRKQLAALKK